MAKKYDIFISYRRKGGVQDARLINEKLLNSGYSVSFDIDTLGRGKFTDTLNTRLKDCKDFVVIFERSYYERFFIDQDCTQVQSEEVLNQDWCYLELKNALALGKNIIPLVPKDFVFPNNLPAGVKEIVEMNAIQLTEKEFKEIFEYKFKNYLLSKPSFKHRHKKSIIGILSFIVIAVVAFLVNQSLETKRLAAEEAARVKAEYDEKIALEKEAAEKRQAFVADSIKKASEQGMQKILDSLARENAKEDSIARANASRVSSGGSSGEKSGGNIFWSGSIDETGNIIKSKLSKVGLKSGRCSGNGLNISSNKRINCSSNSLGTNIKCEYNPQINITGCDGSVVKSLTHSRLSSISKNEADARQKIIEDLRNADFSDWISEINSIER